MSRHKHRRLQRAIDAWVDRELDDVRTRMVADHVRECWGCSSAVETTKLVKRSLRRLGQAQPPPVALVRLRRFAGEVAGG